MRTLTLARRLIHLAAPLVPIAQRRDWLQEWDAELDSLHKLPAKHRRPVRRARGAFADAFWLRQRHVADLDWIDDLRLGWRQMRAHAGFATTAVGTLALGLASTVMMFSVMDQVILRSLPYPDPGRLVTLWETRGDDPEPLDVAPGNFLDWRARLQSFETLAGAEPSGLNFVGGSRPEPFFAARVTPGFFESFGVQPVLGRLFRAEEYQKGNDKVLLLDDAFWRQRFAADPSVVGKVLAFDSGPHVVIGVLPASFEPRFLPRANGYRKVWLPKAIEEYEPRIRASGYWAVAGRLKQGVTLDQAQSELAGVSRQLAIEYPQTNRRTGALVIALRDHLVGNVRVAMALLAGAVLLVLLIACANVANLLLARGSAREREIAIRIALGGRRARVVRQLLTETFVVAFIGAMAGLALASWGLTALARVGPITVPWIDTLHLDGRAFLFAAALIGVITVVSGALPAWRAASAGLAAAGRSTTTADRGQHRLRAGLVVAEIALALVLVAGASLLLRSFSSLLNVDPGFQRDRVAVVQVFASGQNRTPAALWSFFDRSIARLRALPAVQSVGAVSAMPFIESNINIQSNIAIVGQPAAPDQPPRAHMTVVTPGYFAAMRVPLIRGRFLDHHDTRDGKRVAVISEALARRHWAADADPIGGRIRATFDGRPGEVEVVGVVASLRHDSLDVAPREEIFIPHAQVPFGSMTFVLRTAGDAASLLEPAKAAIWEINPAQTIYRSATLDELVMKTVSPRRFALAILLAFALVALLLAAGGVYGVMSAVTQSRLREVGVRTALGAGWWDIMRWVLGQGLTVAGIGVVIGMAGALGAGQLLRGFLFSVRPQDPMSLGAAAGLMVLAGVAACYLPARRAASTDPVQVLRTE